MTGQTVSAYFKHGLPRCLFLLGADYAQKAEFYERAAATRTAAMQVLIALIIIIKNLSILSDPSKLDYFFANQ